jgi:hypothetical protein
MTASNPARYSIAFVAPERPRARLLGSGTLVSFGKLYGVLTAAHVLGALQTVKEIGFAEFTIRPSQPQGLRFPISEFFATSSKAIDAVAIGGLSNESECGPDLAFIRLHDHVAAGLKANSSFLNFVEQAEMSNSFPPADAGRCDIIIGAIQQWAADAPDASVGVLDMGLITGLMNEGNVIEIATHDGYDRLEFLPLSNQEVFPPLASQQIFPPKSYGGTSGGGLWRMYAETMADGKERLVRSRLLGVPYFAKKTNDLLTIICHGPQSIYLRLLEKVRSRWKDELGVDQ